MSSPSRFAPIRIATAVALLGLSFVLSMASVGIILAVMGHFTPWFVFPLVGVTTAVLFWYLVWKLELVATIPASAGSKAVLVVVLGIAAITAINMRYPAQHLSINRDAGAYSVTGVWLAKNGNLQPPGLRGPFAESGVSGALKNDPKLGASGYAFYPDHNRKGFLNAQFMHLTAAILAVAYWIGGALLFVRTNAIFNALALLLFFLLAQRFMKSWIAVTVTLALGIVLPQLWFVRDTYSETISEVVTLGALVLLAVATIRQRRGLFLISGFCLGAIFGSRLDGNLMAIPAAMLFFFMMFGSKDSVKNGWLLLVGYLGAYAIAATDGFQRSYQYLHDVGDKVGQPFGAAIVIVVLGALIMVLPSLKKFGVGLYQNTSNWFPIFAGIATSTLLALLWLVRPLVQKTHGGSTGLVGGLQNFQQIAYDPTRKYGEQTMRWFALYLGPIAVVVAILGAGYLVYLAVGKRKDLLPVAIVLGVPTLVYLYSPSITPDQIWAMRRFVPAAFPLVFLSIGVALDCLSTKMSKKNTRLAIVVAPIVAIAVVAFPLNVLRTQYNVTETRARFDEIDKVCDAFGKNAAVLIIDPTYANNYPQTIEAKCGLPVATAASGFDDINTLARAWKAQGRDLKVLTGDKTPLPNGVKEIARITATARLLELKLK